MTRAFNQYVSCPRCGHKHTAESEFQRWYRNCKELSSNEGHAISDFDFVIHRFKTPEHGRLLQCIMFLEVKTNFATVSLSQAKTLSMARQILQTRGAFSKKEKHLLLDGPKGEKRWVWNFGGFELRLSGLCPLTSSIIQWNRKEVSARKLVEILRFDRDPITMKPMDWRANHHHPERTLPLFV